MGASSLNLMLMTVRILLCLALVAQASCGGSAPREETPAADTTTAAPAPTPSQPDSASRMSDITMTTDTRTYRPGDPVELRIVSKATTRFTYNPCTRQLEREDDEATDKWTPVKEERMCTMVAHVLEPNASRVEQTELGEDLPPGTYRMIVEFIADAPKAKAMQVKLYTMPFKVTSTR
jgi:hypothetical protein